MPELPPVVQDFIANMADYIGPMLEAIAATDAYAAAVARAQEELMAGRRQMLETGRQMQALEAGTRNLASETRFAYNIMTGETRDLLYANEALIQSLEESARANHVQLMQEMADYRDLGVQARYVYDAMSGEIADLGKLQATSARFAHDAIQGQVIDLQNLGTELDIVRSKEVALINEVGSSVAVFERASGAVEQYARASADMVLFAGGGGGSRVVGRDPGLWAAWMRSFKSMGSGLGSIIGTGGGGGLLGGLFKSGGMFGGGAFGLSNTALHWLIMGGTELAAVVVPAMIAAASWATVWAQGAVSIYQHMTAVYTASEATANMLHRTTGQALGLGNALQKAQNAATPQIYQALGGVLNLLKNHIGGLIQAGSQMGKVFDTFLAKVNVEMQGGLGKTMSGLLNQMVPDLTKLGQIFGNLVHAVVNFASKMPGLVQFLLDAAVAVSKLILFLSELPRWLITTFFAMEEAYRWSKLLATALSALSGIKIFSSLTGSSGFISFLASAGSKMVEYFTAGVSVFSDLIGKTSVLKAAWYTIEGLWSTIPGWGQFAIVGAAIAGLTIWILRMKTADQQLIASMQHTVDAASGFKVFGDIARNMAVLQGKIAQVNHYFSSNARHGLVSISVMQVQADRLNTLSAGYKQQVQDMHNADQAAQFLSHAYGISLPAAIALGTEANITWDKGIGRASQAADINRMKVANLVAGYQAMAFPVAGIGHDMADLAIQSGLASSRVNALNQAFAQFMQNITGGTTGLGSFEQSLTNMTNIAATTSNNLSTSTGNMSMSVTQFAASLKSFRGVGSQAWQNFGQVVGSTAPQLIQWLHIAGAEGAVTGHQFSTAVLSMINQLTHFAGTNQTARSQLVDLAKSAGLNVTSWSNLIHRIKTGHVSLNALQKVIEQATLKMGNMGKVAETLGTAVQNGIINTLKQAKLQSSGLLDASVKLNNALQNQQTTTGTLRTDLQNFINALMRSGDTWQQAKAAAIAYAVGTKTHLKEVMRIVDAYAQAIRSVPQHWHTTFSVTTIGSSSIPHIVMGGATGGKGTPGPVVHVHVNGSIVAEHQLANHVQSALLGKAFLGPSSGTFWPGRRR